MTGQKIEIRCVADGRVGQFDVVVSEGNSATKHRVTMTEDMVARLAGVHTAEQMINACFRFLLDREAKEAILAHFDVAIIPRYFPEFEREIGKYF